LPTRFPGLLRLPRCFSKPTMAVNPHPVGQPHLLLSLSRCQLSTLHHGRARRSFNGPPAPRPVLPVPFGERPAGSPSPLSPRNDQPRKETDMRDFETTYARHRELSAKVNELNKAVLFDALATRRHHQHPRRIRRRRRQRPGSMAFQPRPAIRRPNCRQPRSRSWKPTRDRRRQRTPNSRSKRRLRRFATTT
jgi:hypothetical protein